MKIGKYLKAGFRFLKDPYYRFLILSGKGLYNNLSDEEFVTKMYRAVEGEDLDLSNPKSFSAKLQWLKLFNRKSIYSIMVDKYRARDFVKEKIGEQYLIPLIGVWDSPDDIDFDKLPDKFVLKCNHNSGLGMCICKSKRDIDWKKVKDELDRGIKQDYYLRWREWPYKNVPRKIICEQFMIDNSTDGTLTDYKFFCFNGEPKIMYISHDASENATTDFYDMDFVKLPIRMKDPNSDKVMQKPECFEEMKELARVLSKDVPFLRVDFYYINNSIYFGELTFFHNAGFVKIYPEEWNYILGDWVKLPAKQYNC